jgi:hypothetical protein
MIITNVWSFQENYWQKVCPDKKTLKINDTMRGKVPLHRQTEKFKQGVKWVISENLQNKLDMMETKAILSDLFVRIEILHSGIHYKFLALSGKHMKFCGPDKEPFLRCSMIDGLKLVY